MPSPPAGDDGTLLDTPNQMEQSNQSDLDPVELPEAELDQPVEGEPDGPGEGGGGRRRRVLALAVGGLILVAAIVGLVLSLSHKATPHRPGAGPGSPPASPARVPFQFQVASTTVTSYTGKGNAGAARKAAERIRVVLSGWYDAAFMDPAEWRDGPAASAFGVFDPKVRGLAKSKDLKTLSLGKFEDLESLAPTNTRLTICVLLDPSLHAVAAVATVRFDAQGVLSGGDLLSVDHTASFVFRLTGSRWLIRGYEGVKTKLDQVPAPSPSPKAGPSATASAST